MSYEKLERLLTELKENDNPKLVEGRKDKENLEYFGMSNILLIHSGPLKDLVDKVDSKEVIILTDFDRRGQLLTKQLTELCKNEGIKVNLYYRLELRRLTGINTFEELVPRYEKIMNEYRGVNNGKNLHRYSKIRGLRRPGDRRHS